MIIQDLKVFKEVYVGKNADIRVLKEVDKYVHINLSCIGLIEQNKTTNIVINLKTFEDKIFTKPFKVDLFIDYNKDNIVNDDEKITVDIIDGMAIVEFTSAELGDFVVKSLNNESNEYPAKDGKVTIKVVEPIPVS